MVTDILGGSDSISSESKQSTSPTTYSQKEVQCRVGLTKQSGNNYRSPEKIRIANNIRITSCRQFVYVHVAYVCFIMIIITAPNRPRQIKTKSLTKI